MYCPKCSQRQASERQRFCSRCGFPLSGVAALVADDGAPPAPSKEESARRRSPRYEGVRQGVLLLMLAVVLLPLVDIIGPPYHEALVFMFLLAGAMRAGYALIFQEGAAGRPSDASEHSSPRPGAAELGGEHGPALPPAGSIPAADFISRRERTAGAAGPPSVTENTTRLLEDR